MACKYRIYQNTNDKSNGFGKYYARRRTQGLVSFQDLSRRLAARHTTFSEGVMLGLLTDMTELVRELCYEGKSVKIDNLGIFWVSMKSNGVGDANKFDASTDITSRWRCRPTGDGSGKAIGVTRAGGVELHWEEDANYTSPRTKTAGGTTVDEG